MIKKTLTLCTLATLTLFAHPHTMHLYDAIEDISKDKKHAIKQLLEQCKHDTEEKQEQIKSHLTWGVAHAIAALTAHLIRKKNTKYEVGAGMASYILATLSAKNIGHCINNYFRNHNEHKESLQSIEEALTTLQAEKNTKT